MQRFNLWILAILLAAVLSTPGTIRAVPLLKVDFGVSGAASPVQPGFTGVAGEVAEATHSASIGPYTVDLQGQGFFSAGAANNINSSVRSLYRDYYYNNSTINGDGIVLSLGGFNPSTQYNVTLWSYDADLVFPPPTPTTWAPFGSTTGTSGLATNFATPYPTTLNDNNTTIQVTSTTGTLDIFGTTTGGHGGTRLNGVKVNDGTADLLSVDFGRTSQPSSPVQSTYTGVMGEVAQPTFSQVVGTYNVSLEGQGFFNTTSSNADFIGAGVKDLYRDYYYNNSITNGQGVKLTVDGVTPNTDYNLTLLSYDADNFDPTPTTWTPTGATTGQTGNVTNIQTPYPTSPTDYSTTIRVHSTTSSLQVFGTTTGGGGGTRLNGFEMNLAPLGVDGDYNNNGTVDAADYVVWLKNQGTSNTLPNDPTGGTIGVQQYNTWRAHFGQSSGSGIGINGTTVPEPSCLVLVLTITLCPVGHRCAKGGNGAFYKRAFSSRVMR